MSRYPLNARHIYRIYNYVVPSGGDSLSHHINTTKYLLHRSSKFKSCDQIWWLTVSHHPATQSVQSIARPRALCMGKQVYSHVYLHNLASHSLRCKAGWAAVMKPITHCNETHWTVIQTGCAEIQFVVIIVKLTRCRSRQFRADENAFYCASFGGRRRMLRTNERVEWVFGTTSVCRVLIHEEKKEEETPVYYELKSVICCFSTRTMPLYCIESTVLKSFMLMFNIRR